MATEFPIRVMLVDDNPRFRAVLRQLLERDDGIVVVGEADRGDVVVEMVAKQSPHVVLMDLSMPGVNGLNATLELKRHFPGVEVVMLSVSDEADGVISLLSGAASAYVDKAAPAADIINALKDHGATASGVHAET
jgi:DNA-binding NarL/FixJ family response regulator